MNGTNGAQNRSENHHIYSKKNDAQIQWRENQINKSDKRIYRSYTDYSVIVHFYTFINRVRTIFIFLAFSLSFFSLCLIFFSFILSLSLLWKVCVLLLVSTSFPFVLSLSPILFAHTYSCGRSIVISWRRKQWNKKKKFL